MRSWKQYNEENNRRDALMADFFEEFCDEWPAILESEVKPAVEALGNNKSLRTDKKLIEWFLATGIVCQNPKMNMPSTTQNKSMAYRFEMFSVHSNPQKKHTKECNNCIIVLTSHASIVIFKDLEKRLLSYMAWEIPNVQAGFWKCRVTRDHIVNICWLMKHTRDFQKKANLCFIDKQTLCGPEKVVHSKRNGCASTLDRLDARPILWTRSHC